MIKGPTSELFIVQKTLWDVASNVRDRSSQAVLDIDSDIIPIDGADIDRVLDDENVKSIVASLGAGIALVEPHVGFALERLRYGKIILVMDGSEAGRHIRSQIIMFLHQYMAPVITAGRVFATPEEDWGTMSDEEFEARVMSAATRTFNPISQ